MNTDGIRGVFFRTDEDCNKVILHIIKHVSSSQYVWEVDQVNHTNGLLEKNFPGIFSQKDVEDFLKEEGIILMISLMRFPADTHKRCHDIKNYEEFVESDCSMALLCCDSGWHEMYIKDKAEVDQIFGLLSQLRHKRLEYITDENDGRYSFCLD